MRRLLDWLFNMRTTDKDNEIEKRKRAIAERARSIEATIPIAEEAIKRTDDAYYKLRTKVKVAERRIDRAGHQLMKDLDDGWDKHS